MANFDFEFTEEMIVRAIYELIIKPLNKKYHVPLANYILKMDENINGSE